MIQQFVTQLRAKLRHLVDMLIYKMEKKFIFHDEPLFDSEGDYLLEGYANDPKLY